MNPRASVQGPAGAESVKPVVLCVDDDTGTLMALKRLLRNEPYDLMTTEDPRQALEWIEERDVHVLLTDERMPEMNGTELLKRLKDRRPGAVPAIMTAYADVNWLTEIINRGDIQCLVHKPWDDEELKRSIRQMVLKGVQMREGRFEDRKSHRKRGTAGVELDHFAFVNCKGRTTEDLLKSIRRIPKQLKVPYTRTIIVLVDLNLIDGSVTGFLQSLTRDLRERNRRAFIVDVSGTLCLFQEIVGGTVSSLCDRLPGGPKASSRRVLVVNPNSIESELLQSLLHAAGYRYDAADTIEEALINLHEKAYDLIMVDIGHAEEIEFERRMFERNALTKVVPITFSHERVGDVTYARLMTHQRVAISLGLKAIQHLVEGN